MCNETRPNDTAFSIPETKDNIVEWGLTKREYFATMAMQGMLGHPGNGLSTGDATPKETRDDPAFQRLANCAVIQADALIAELNKPAGKGKDKP